MKKIFQKKAFSLIEIMVVISIMVIILTMSYAPYNFYQNKAKVKLATKELSQSFYEARNMAVSGIQKKEGDGEEKSKYVGILLSKEENENSFIKYYYIDTDSVKEDETIDESKIVLTTEINKKEIQKGVSITEFPGLTGVNKVLLLYTFDGKIFLLNGTSFQKIDKPKLDVELAFQKSNSDLLKRKITYYLKTNIVDYEKK